MGEKASVGLGRAGLWSLAGFPNLFRSQKFSQASENRAAGIFTRGLRSVANPSAAALPLRGGSGIPGVKRHYIRTSDLSCPHLWGQAIVALVVAANQPTTQCSAPNRLANTCNFSSDRWSQ